MKKAAFLFACLLMKAMCVSATVAIVWSWDSDGGGNGGSGVVQDHMGNALGSNCIVQLIWSPDANIGPLDPANPLVPTGGDQLLATQGTPDDFGWWTFESVCGSASTQHVGGYVYQRVFDVAVGSTPGTGDYYEDGKIVTGPLSGALGLPTPMPDVSYFLASADSPLRVDTLIQADSDHNGVPDDWTQRYFGDPTNMNAAEDSDSDGMNNGEEYLADTDPTNSGSLLEISGLQLSPTGLEVDWSGGTGAWQYLESRQDLLSTTEQWIVVFTNQPPMPQTTNITIEAGDLSPLMYYRLRAVR